MSAGSVSGKDRAGTASFERQALHDLLRRGLLPGPPSPVRKVEQERLAIIRNVSIEYVRGLNKRRIIGYLVEVPIVFLLLHTDPREQESFPCHFQIHGSHVPMAGDNFCLPNLKVASLVQVSQQAESEFHGLCEMSIKRSQALLFAVDPHLAFHVMEKRGPPGMAG